MEKLEYNCENFKKSILLQTKAICDNDFGTLFYTNKVTNIVSCKNFIILKTIKTKWI